MRRISLSALLLLFTACTRAASTGEPVGDSHATDTKPVVTSEQSDWKAIEQLEAEAKSIVKIEGCTSSADCRTVAIGSRGCGGPRYHIAYCSKTTDSVSLFKKAAEIAKAEQEYNKKYQIGSTCELRMPPLVESTGGSCVAK